MVNEVIVVDGYRYALPILQYADNCAVQVGWVERSDTHLAKEWWQLSPGMMLRMQSL